MRERARLRGACDAAARRWLHHLVAAALRAWREHGALWQRVLLGLGRRSARDELRRGMLTWCGFAAARAQALGSVRAAIARWRQRRRVRALGTWRCRVPERRQGLALLRTSAARWRAWAMCCGFAAWREAARRRLGLGLGSG